MSKQQRITIVFIDEAHIVDMWGNGKNEEVAFRGDFGKLDEVLAALTVSFVFNFIN